MNTNWRICCTLGTIFLASSGCSGGGGGDSRNFNTLGGEIKMSLVNQPSGAVTGLQLSDGVETYDLTLPPQTSGKVAFTFPTALSQGTPYAISVVDSPTGFACTPSANASGTMGSAPISNVTVTCTDSVFTVSGAVQLNLVNALTSNVELGLSDGTDIISVQLPAGATTARLPAFSFPTSLKTGAQYRITVPINPTDLICTTVNASGTITSDDVHNVLVTCADNAFELSGEVKVSLQNPYSSNTATVVLTDGPDSLATATVTLGSGLAGRASFTFPNLVAQGAAYTVSVPTSPAGSPSGLTCTPSNNTGTITSANITNIAVQCSDAAYSLGGTVTGLQFGGSVELSDSNESITVGQGPASYTFAFPTALAYNSPYRVTIKAQSLVQCSLGNGTGSVPGPVTDLALSCSLPELALLAGSAGASNPLIDPRALIGPFTGVAVDAAGNLYVDADYEEQIFKITPAGVVTILAGSATAGSADGTGSAASFNTPAGLAVDVKGNVYVADVGNNEIRKITAAGVVTTLAGSTASGSSNGSGSRASFNAPAGVTVDAAGNVYVADTGNNEIRKVTPAGVVTTLAGSTTSGSADGTGSGASFNAPAGVTVDATGNVYVGDTGNNDIRKITPAGVVTTLAGSTTAGSSDGTGSAASLNSPLGVAVDSVGNLYVADYGNNEIRKITAAGVVSTLAGSTAPGYADGTGSAARFYEPFGVAVDAMGNVYVADEVNLAIRKVTPARVVTTLAGSTTTGSADGTGSAAQFYGPFGVAVDAAGNVYVADGLNNEIRKITPTGVVTTLAGSGVYGSSDGTGSTAQFALPFGLAVDAAGNVYVGDEANNEIRKITPAGVVTTFAGSTTNGSTDGTGSVARFYLPSGVALDTAGNLYVADSANVKIRKITPAGVVTTLAGSGAYGSADGTGSAASFNLPAGVAVDAAGNVYVADAGNNEIRKITPARVVTTLAGSTTAGSSDGTGSAARFNDPLGVAVDRAGNVYVADSGNNEIRKVTPTGLVTTIVGNPSATQLVPGLLPGSLGSPGGIALSAADGQGDWNMAISTSQGYSKQFSAIAEIPFANGVFD